MARLTVMLNQKAQSGDLEYHVKPVMLQDKPAPLTLNQLARRAQIDVHVEADSLPFEGNCIAISAEVDRAYEGDLRARLARGEFWRWCQLRVTASYDGVTGYATTGGCSYTTLRIAECTARKELRLEALADLQRELARGAS